MNKKYVINLSRQFGSGGLEIAEKLSKKLGIPYYDKKLITISSKKSGLEKDFIESFDEQTPTVLSVESSGWFSSFFNWAYQGGSLLLSASMFKIQSDIIRQLARKESCIFVGRCADYVLRDYQRCINIFINADIEYRIERISSQNSNCKNICDRIETTDKQRAKYYSFYSGKSWGAAKSYHLCINSGFLGIDETVEYLYSFIVKKLDLK